MPIVEIFATIGALVVGACAGQIAFMFWRGDLRLQLVRKAEPAPAPQPEPITDDEFAVVHAWARLNPWYTADPVLNLDARHIHMSLQQREPHLTLKANLAAVTAEMHRRHPEIVTTAH